MTRHRYLAPLLGLIPLLALFLSCSSIPEDERLIEVTPTEPEEPSSIARRVLLEDFTGQRCPNCPRGTEVIEQLEKAYPDQLVVVGIHGGPLGFKGTASVTGLATELGDTYYQHWQLEYQPVGLVNRGGAVNYTDWMTAVSREAGRTSDIEMEAEAQCDGSTVSITVREKLLKGSFAGMLQVWVTEDNITAIQTMPDGTNNREYVHHHVLRTSVNGTWGESLTLRKDETKVQSMTQAVDAAWNPSNLNIVAFAYNNDGVAQAVKVRINESSDK